MDSHDLLAEYVCVQDVVMNKFKHKSIFRNL